VLLKRVAQAAFVCGGELEPTPCQLLRAAGMADHRFRKSPCEKMALPVRYLDRVLPPFAVARNTFGSNRTFFAFFVMTDPLEAPTANIMWSLLTTPDFQNADRHDLESEEAVAEASIPTKSRAKSAFAASRQSPVRRAKACDLRPSLAV
jgi:hypothetical protein